MTNDPIIKIEQLEKSFGDLHVLKGIDLEVNRGEVVCISEHPALANRHCCAASTYWKRPTRATSGSTGRI